MPLIDTPSYRSRPLLFFNRHIETIFPSLFFKAVDINYQRERLELADGDFLDLDWVQNHNTKLMIISHGLEGGTDRYYVKRTANYFSQRGWDILAWNCRSCSGEMNRLPCFYHHGATHDLADVVDHALKNRTYQQAVLFGYSMGGSLSLKYLGENPGRDSRIRGAVTFSVPCSLHDSARQLERRENRIYKMKFLKKLLVKIQKKALEHPGVIPVDPIENISSFDDFHRHYTVPLHGFENIGDFYKKATCDQFLPQINRPVLIVNAQNDPMLGKKCYPREVASQNPNVYLEIPTKGGHTGFTLWGKDYSWMELRAEAFLKILDVPASL